MCACVCLSAYKLLWFECGKPQYVRLHLEGNLKVDITKYVRRWTGKCVWISWSSPQIDVFMWLISMPKPTINTHTHTLCTWLSFSKSFILMLSHHSHSIELAALPAQHKYMVMNVKFHQRHRRQHTHTYACTISQMTQPKITAENLKSRKACDKCVRVCVCVHMWLYKNTRLFRNERANVSIHMSLSSLNLFGNIWFLVVGDCICSHFS